MIRPHFAVHSGPLRDHTTGLKNGGYVYLSSSLNPQDIGKKASLYGPQFAAHSEADNCRLRFFWHMYGSTMGAFRVWTVSAAGIEPVVCQMYFEHAEHNFGDAWRRESIVLRSDNVFRVYFEGTVGGNSSDIVRDLLCNKIFSKVIKLQYNDHIKDLFSIFLI